LRAFFNLARTWGLSVEQQRALLGWPARSTFFKFKDAPNSVILSFDSLVRISALLGIYKALHILYPDAKFADQWPKLPNSNPLFGGRPALDLMVDGGIDALYQVRRLLDGRRGG